jgi:hypothetical protein
MNNPFDGEGGTAIANLDSTTSVMVQMAQAELNQAVTTARAFPRSMALAVSRITSLATMDPQAATECVYALPRGGKPIRGPSVRFAEIVGAMYGNCHIGSRIVAVDRMEKVVIAEGVFFDLETGMKRVTQVQRRISDKGGKLFNDDMIAMTGNAACSIAMREAVLKGVPKAIWRAAYDAVEKINFGTAETITVRRGNAIAKFAGFGIKPEQIFACLEVGGLEDIGLEEIATLTSMFIAIRNEEATVESYFPPVAPAALSRRAASTGPRVASAKPDLIEAKAEPAKAEPAKVETKADKVDDYGPGPAGPAKATDPAPTEGAAKLSDYDDLVGRVRRAETKDELAAVWGDEKAFRLENESPDLFAKFCDICDQRELALAD